MATAAAISLNVEDRSSRASVPPHDIPRLMYYLGCMDSLGPRPRDPAALKVPRKLIDYANWRRLNFKDIRDLVGWCRLLAIDTAPVKDFVVCDVDKEVCGIAPKYSDCSFLGVSADFSVVSVGRSAIVTGSARGIGKKYVLFYLPRWLKRNYTDPLENVSLYHCMHCAGVEGTCRCKVEKCDRPGSSRCYILRPREHHFECDGCDDELYVTGVLYMCSACHNYGLCRPCYDERQVHDLTHPFKRSPSQERSLFCWLADKHPSRRWHPNRFRASIPCRRPFNEWGQGRRQQRCTVLGVSVVHRSRRPLPQQTIGSLHQRLERLGTLCPPRKPLLRKATSSF